MASYLTKYLAKCVSWSESKGACVDSQCDVTSWLAWYCSSRLSTKAKGEILRTTLKTCIPRRLWPITDFWNLFLISQSYFKFSFPMPRIYLKFHYVITTGQLDASLKTAVVEAHIWGICSRNLILSRLITHFWIEVYSRRKKGSSLIWTSFDFSWLTLFLLWYFFFALSLPFQCHYMKEEILALFLAKKDNVKYIVDYYGTKLENGTAYICMQFMKSEKKTSLTVCKSICLTVWICPILPKSKKRFNWK